MPDIPPPTPEDLARDLAHWYERTRDYSRCPSFWLECAIRRAAEAEAERDRLREAADFVLAGDHSPETFAEAMDALREEMRRQCEDKRHA